MVTNSWQPIQKLIGILVTFYERSYFCVRKGKGVSISGKKQNVIKCAMHQHSPRRGFLKRSSSQVLIW